MPPSITSSVPRNARRTLSILGVMGLIILTLLILRGATHMRLAGSGDVSDNYAADPSPSDKTTTVAQRNENAASGANARKTRGLVEFLPRPSDEEERILTALATPVDVEFLDLPLEDCLTFLY